MPLFLAAHDQRRPAGLFLFTSVSVFARNDLLEHKLMHALGFFVRVVPALCGQTGVQVA